MMNTRPNLPVYIGNDAVSELIRFYNKSGFMDFCLVADENTYTALGRVVEAALLAEGCNVLSIILHGEEIIADEYSVVQVLRKIDRKERTFLAVGSGTITDITRFVSHRTRTSFLSLPTAPSVDGFTSIGAPLVIGGFKQTVLCQPPLAVFADLETLCKAPHRMVASGFGDLLGKLVSVADWKLGHVVWEEPYDEGIAQRARSAAWNCAVRADEIGKGDAESIRLLIEGLIESGFCMLDFGDTMPASGAEHHIAHHWEMVLLREKRKAALHGAKVGVASVITSRWYDAVREMSRQEADSRMKFAPVTEREALVTLMKNRYGPKADELIVDQSFFIDMPESSYNSLKQHILKRWDEIRAIVASVPSSLQMIDWLSKAGAPVKGEAIGLTEQDIQEALQLSHYTRKRFTINKLRSMLGIE